MRVTLKLYDVKVYSEYPASGERRYRYDWLDMIVSAHSCEQAEECAYSLLAGKTYKEAFGGINAKNYMTFVRDRDPEYKCDYDDWKRIGFDNVEKFFFVKATVLDGYKFTKDIFPPP